LIEGWSTPLHGLVNNAGLQFSGPTSFNHEGVETTFAVNHLGPLQLTLGLLPWLEAGRVIGVGSGTHNPSNRTATMFGFRGGRFTDVERLARGEVDATSDRQRGMDRYATSKLCAMVTTMELARRYPKTTFATFDPGMMPGTGLLRTGPWYARAAWSSVLRWLVPLLDDTSTPERSAHAARKLLFDYDLTSGAVYGHEGTPSKRVWTGARDPRLAQRVLDESLAFLAQHSTPSHALNAHPIYTCKGLA
jgi:NAD(P)-dependent dehydrogenase (short-subunit alcohol dehydrogenase family)